MGRAPCCDKTKVKRGPWSPEEDAKLRDYIEKYGNGGNWISLPLKAGKYICCYLNSTFDSALPVLQTPKKSVCYSLLLLLFKV